MTEKCIKMVNINTSEPHEKIPLLGKVKDCIVEMCSQGEVLFSFGEQPEKIRSRRLTIKSTSPVIASIIRDAWQNGRQQETIELPDVQPEHFRNFLKYVEEDENFSSAHFTLDEVADILKIAKSFSVAGLEEKCRNFLQSARNVGNAITIYQYAQYLDEHQLENDTFAFITEYFSQVLHEKDFTTLSHPNLCTFLKLDEIIVPELELYFGVIRWAEAECTRQGLEKTSTSMRILLQNAVHLIRFPLMTLTEFNSRGTTTKEVLHNEEIKALTQYLHLTDCEKQRNNGARIYPFNHKRRGVAPPQTFTVSFYKGLIYNSELWTNKWNYNIIKVNRPIDITSFGFDGPIVSDAIYNVRIKLVMLSETNSDQENNNSTSSMNNINLINNNNNYSGKIVGFKEDIVAAKRERTFHVKFDTPVSIKPNVPYKASYSLFGPKTIWGVNPRKVIKMACGDKGPIEFTFHYVDGQIPDIRFTIPS